jgi:putative transposase
VITAHKIEIKPNNKQANFLLRSCGTARYAYNMALDLWNKEYLSGNKPTANSIDKEMNKIKPKWCYEVSKCCVQSSIIDLGKAFSNFFKNKHFKPPTFKKKGQKDSFRLNNEHFKINNKKLKIAKLDTKIKLTEKLRFEGKLLFCTISRKANKWFASINIEVEDLPKKPMNQEPRFIGVDLGLKTLAVTSEGVIYDNLKPHKNKLQKLRRLNKSLSRKVLGSQNFKKAKVKLGLLHYKIANIRKDYLHKVTSDLVKGHDVITIEDLNVLGMSKNRKLSRSILDASFGIFKTLLEYKCQRKNVILVKANRFYPSTKTCSKCGSIQEIKLNERTYACSKCNMVIDRDYNASINLNNYGKNYIAGLATKVCGLESSDSGDRVKLSKMKQKSNIKANTVFNRN